MLKTIIRTISLVITICWLLLAPRSVEAQDSNASTGSLERSAMELINSLHLGWNLGNALDAPGEETAWGNPTIKPDLLRRVADVGFDIVRVPVTWSPHLGPGPEFKIEAERLRRVEEVVGYVNDAGLYAIINLHHDGADGMQGVEWLTVNDADGNTTEANNQKVETQFKSVWTQIAKHFANHGKKLIFESMNEVHDGYGKVDPRHVEFVNRLNQTFVDCVRRSGGNNDQRFLVVPGYNTDISATIDGFQLPKDPATDKLILSVHYYDPYLFTLRAETHTWGSQFDESDEYGQEQAVVRQFDRLKEKFIDQGVPVIIGEYGATLQEGFEDYRKYYIEYITRAASQRGMVPIYWDNGAMESGAEAFALFDRQSAKPIRPQLIKVMRNAATQSYRLSEIQPPSK